MQEVTSNLANISVNSLYQSPAFASNMPTQQLQFQIGDKEILQTNKSINKNQCKLFSWN
jgi:hypothetical protein